MSQRLRWIAPGAAGALVIAGGVYFAGSHTATASAAPSGLPAGAKSLAVRCYESLLSSCLETLPPYELGELGEWADETSPTVQQFVAGFYGGSATDQQQAVQNLEAAGFEAAAHESFQSEAGYAPFGDILVVRFDQPQEASAYAAKLESDWSGSSKTTPSPSVSVPGLPGHVVPGKTLDALSYVRASYATAVGDMVMVIIYNSYKTFDEKDFAVTAGAEYLSLKSAPAPASA